MFTSRSRSQIQSIRNITRSSLHVQNKPIINRSYTSRFSSNHASSSSNTNLGQTILIAVASLSVGGLIISQRGRVINEAATSSIKKDKAMKNEPVYIKEEPKSSVPEIVSRKEEEAEESQKAESATQGAFNEETGEINWDCPCLGGMADGPCGEDFKAAFSCFVYSEAEPKGVDCVEKFKGMQDCFRKHPEIYGEEIEDDENANISGSEGGEEIGSVDAPSITAQPVVDPAAVKSEAAQGAAVGTL